MGFPGVGWLFAGFPLIASILLMAGPAITWAVIPVAFSPYGQGPLREIGWRVELAWLPTMALVSSALLYRAHARRRRRLLGGPPPRGRTRRVGAYRARVSAAIGAMFLLLIAIPFVPALAGVGGSTVRYSYEPRLTHDVTGQFVATARGPVKLFAWDALQSGSPADALRLHASDVHSLLVRAAAVDAPGAYQLLDLGRGGSVSLRVQKALPQELVLAPTRALRPGRYVFAATHEGMFGGRDFSYLDIVPASAAVTAISSRPHAAAPAVLDALLPLCAALLALTFASLLVRSLLRRRSGEKVLWGIGFTLFAIAAGCEALAQRSGWSPALFRTYYLAGGVLTVAYLGAGSAWLLLPKRGRDVLVGGLLVATVAAVVTVALADVHAGTLAATAHGRPPANAALAGHAFLWAVALNTFGSVFLIGGSLYSIARRRRVRPNLWIGGGALVVALATGLSRAGAYDLVYAGELVGIALMFTGFAFVSKPAPKRRRAAQPPVAYSKATAA
jgi:hypothetical protein